MFFFQATYNAKCHLDIQRSKEEQDENKLDLSMAYSILGGHLWKATDIRQFCSISETMELMLRNKVKTLHLPSI